MKQYKYKAKDYRRKVKKYWKLLEHYEDNFYMEIGQIEKLMAHDLGIKGMEFIYVDGCIVGIGTSSKSLELIHR